MNEMKVESDAVTIGEWIGFMIMLAIPLVGFIVLIVYAISNTAKESMKTFAKATLIIYGIGILLYMFLLGIIL